MQRMKIGRLSRGKDLEAVLRRGRRVSSEFFRIAVGRSGQTAIRLTVIAGKVTDKRAVARNELRRRAREYVRTHQDLIPAGRDIAIMIKKEAVGLSRSEFYGALRDILSRIP